MLACDIRPRTVGACTLRESATNLGQKTPTHRHRRKIHGQLYLVAPTATGEERLHMIRIHQSLTVHPKQLRVLLLQLIQRGTEVVTAFAVIHRGELILGLE